MAASDPLQLKMTPGGFRCMRLMTLQYCKALCDVKCSQIEGNVGKFSHIELNQIHFLTVYSDLQLLLAKQKWQLVKLQEQNSHNNKMTVMMGLYTFSLIIQPFKHISERLSQFYIKSFKAFGIISPDLLAYRSKIRPSINRFYIPVQWRPKNYSVLTDLKKISNQFAVH